MSANPQDMQQMLAMYKSLYGNPQLQGLNQIQHGLAGGAPVGTNTTSGGVNAAAQLMVALMKAQKQKQLQQQAQNPQSPPGTTPPVPMVQGQTTSSPAATPMGTPMTSGGL